MCMAGVSQGNCTHSKRIVRDLLTLPHLALLPRIVLPRRFVHPVIEPVRLIRPRSSPRFILNRLDINIEQILSIRILWRIGDVDSRLRLSGGGWRSDEESGVRS